MAADLSFQTDPLLELLTDALRDGPGSPSWAAALKRLNEADASNGSAATVDEYRRLCQAREHLESGKEFRSIRPGPAFTQRFWAAMDADGSRRTPSTRRVLMLVAGLCVLLGCAAVIWEMIPRGSSIERETSALAGMLFAKPIASLLPTDATHQGWQAIGALPLAADRDFALSATASQSLPAGGGFVLTTPIPADQPFAIEARFQVNRSNADLVPEVAISDVNDFENATATSSHELVFALEGKQAKVIDASGHLAGQFDVVGDGRGEVAVRVRVDRQAMIVEMNGRTVFAGASGLSTSNGRFVAVRILRRGASDSQNILLHSLRVLSAP